MIWSKLWISFVVIVKIKVHEYSNVFEIFVLIHMNADLSYDGCHWSPGLCVFGSVVAGAFQIAFRAEMHANDVFLFFKNYFWHQHIKTIQKVQTALNFNKKKIQIWTKRRYKHNTKRRVSILAGPVIKLIIWSSEKLRIMGKVTTYGFKVLRLWWACQFILIKNNNKSIQL